MILKTLGVCTLAKLEMSRGVGTVHDDYDAHGMEGLCDLGHRKPGE